LNESAIPDFAKGFNAARHGSLCHENLDPSEELLNLFTRMAALGFITIFISGNVFAAEYSLRKYEHVKTFYQSIAQSAIDLGLEHNVPPAAILAMAGVESGYGRGYVARITGNILSLGARKGEAELPPLNLPTHIPTDKVLVDKDRIASTPDEELKWKERLPSLKKDYRPDAFAGTEKRLAFLQRNPDDRIESRRANISDFVSSWISDKSAVPLFAEARTWLDQTVADEGKDSLLSCKMAKAFISRIGGKPRSFNHRESWVKKVNTIMDRGGLCSLTQAMSEGTPFDIAWTSQTSTASNATADSVR